MSKKTLTHERLRELLHYNSATGDFTRLLSVTNARGGRVGDRPRAIDAHGYHQLSVDGKLYKAHRLAWFYMTGAWPTNDIDHINGIRTDNRFSNLREATRQENLRNTSLRSDNSSGVKGVSWDKHRSRWRSYIIVNGKQKALGYFHSKGEAAQARKDAELKEFGEFVRAS